MSTPMAVSRKSFRHVMKSVALALLANPVVSRAKLGNILAAESLTILCLHRVADGSDGSSEALSPALFDELLGWLKRHFNIITFGELGHSSDDPRPPLVLSFDDGYADFYEIALPILCRHGLKVNHNVIPGCIESGLPPINVIVQDFLLSAPEKLLSELEFAGLSTRFQFTDRARLALSVSAAVKAMPIIEQRQLMARLSPDFERFDGFRTTPMMTRTQVVETAGAHEIGVHSWEHASMSVESDEYLLDDVRRCKDFLADLGAVPSFIYAFPNGLLRDEQAAAVHAAGFDHVLSVGENFSRPTNWLHNRFTFYGDTIAEARFRALGSFRYPPRL